MKTLRNNLTKTSLRKRRVTLARKNDDENPVLDSAIVLVFCTAFLFMSGFCYLYSYLGEFGIPLDSIEFESHKVLLYGTKSFLFFYTTIVCAVVALSMLFSLAKHSNLNQRKHKTVFLIIGLIDGFLDFLFNKGLEIVLVLFPFALIIRPSLSSQIYLNAIKNKQKSFFVIRIVTAGLLWAFVVGVVHGFDEANDLKELNDRAVFVVSGNSDDAILLKQIVCGESKCAFYSESKKVAYIIGNEQIKIIQYANKQHWFANSILDFTCSIYRFVDCNDGR